MTKFFSIIGGISAIISLLIFFGGRQYFYEYMAAARDLGKDAPGAVTLPQPRPALERRSISQFSVVRWIQPLDDREPLRPGVALAVAPKRHLFGKPSLVLLSCSTALECSAQTLLFLPSSMKSFDATAIDSAMNVVSIDRFGNGIISRQGSASFTPFHLGFPCKVFNNFVGRDGVGGGIISIQNMSFNNHSLEMDVFARKCSGSVSVNSTPKDAGINHQAITSGDFFYFFKTRLDFDSIDQIQGAEISLYRASSRPNDLPEWFSYASLTRSVAPNELDVVASRRGELVRNALQRHPDMRMYVSPNIPATIRLVGYLDGDLTADTLQGVLDDSTNGSAMPGIFFSNDGVVSHGNISATSRSYQALYGQNARRVFNTLIFDDEFRIPANRLPADFVREVISDVSESVVAGSPVAVENSDRPPLSR